MAPGHGPSALHCAGYRQQKYKVGQACQDSPEIPVLAQQFSRKKSAEKAGQDIDGHDACRHRKFPEIELEQQKGQQQKTGPGHGIG